jgi:hypothetical protein
VLNLSGGDREQLAALGVTAADGGQLRTAGGAAVDDGTAALLLKQARHPDTGRYTPAAASSASSAGTEGPPAYATHADFGLPAPVRISRPDQFTRPYLDAGHQAETASGVPCMPVPHPAEAEDFRRGPLDDGHQDAPPADDPGGNNPYPGGVDTAELYATAVTRLAVNHQTARRDHITEAVVPHHMPVPDTAKAPAGIAAVHLGGRDLRGATSRAPGEDR